MERAESDERALREEGSEAEERATGTPFWFGVAESPLFGWLHLPADGQARAGVILCPPIGVEGRVSHATFRALAQQLVEAGFAVLRFDYEGTGDSGGMFGAPGRIDSWLSSITRARTTMKQQGAERIAVVGMRIGATLAAVEASLGEPPDALILWDPCVSGRSFLREQVALSRMGLGAAKSSGGAVVTPGYVYPPAMAKSLSELSIAELEPPLAERTLVLVRPDRTPSRALRERLPPPEVEWQDALGQRDLLDVPSLLDEVPSKTVDAIESWLCGVFDEQRSAVKAPPPEGRSAIVGRDRNNAPVVEHAVRLGPGELFGIVTASEKWAAGPTVLFLNDGHDHRTGSARSWVDLGRRLAADGLRTLRFDLSGIGDSAARPGQAAAMSRNPSALDDLLDAARAVSPEDPSDTVFVGQCSGGYHALEAGLALTPRGVCAVNPLLTVPPPEVQVGKPTDARRRAQRHMPKPLRELESRHPRFAQRIWQLFTQLAVQKSPMQPPATLARRGVNTLLVCAPEDDRQFQGSLYWQLVWRRLIRAGVLHHQRIDGLDHGLAAQQPREELLDVLATHISGSFGATMTSGRALPTELDSQRGAVRLA